jgi:predicted NAD-dependent protein-ADP-ribosyltransferase YbiA (DUF1768 family)
VDPITTLQALKTYYGDETMKLGDHGVIFSEDVTVTLFNNGTLLVQKNHKCIEWGLEVWPKIQELLNPSSQVHHRDSDKETTSEEIEDSEGCKLLQTIEHTMNMTPRAEDMSITLNLSGEEKQSLKNGNTYPKELLANKTNPLYETPVAIQGHSKTFPATPHTPNRSAYKIAEEANYRVAQLEVNMTKMYEQFISHCSHVEHLMTNDLRKKEEEIKGRDDKIINLREEVHNLQAIRSKLSDDINHLKEDLRKAIEIHKNKEAENKTILEELKKLNMTREKTEQEKEQAHSNSKQKVVNETHSDSENSDSIPPKSEVIDRNTYIKGDHNILSMLYPVKIWYRAEQYDTPEHAYQCTKIKHTLGDEEDLYHAVKTSKDGKAAKAEAKKAPYSRTWQKIKSNELENICHARVNQDVQFKSVLEATEDSPLVHNVASEFWGMGRSGKGKNQYGRTLERIRKNLNNGKHIEQHSDQDKEHLVLRTKATSVLLCDSVLKNIDLRRFRGTQTQIHKQHVRNSQDLLNVSNALDSNNNITEVVIHVGVNDLADGESPSKLCENLQDAVNIMREKLPKATFVISDLVAAEYRKVEHANKEIDKLTAKLHCTHSKHYLRSHMFSDDVHPTSQGMAVLVTDINRTLNPRPDEPQRNKGFRPNDSYRPSYRKMSSFNRRFENNNRPYDSRNDNPYESRDFRSYDYSTRSAMRRPYW